MGEAHRHMSYEPKGGFRHQFPDAEEVARRIKKAEDRYKDQVAKLAAEGISLGDRPLSMFIR